MRASCALTALALAGVFRENGDLGYYGARAMPALTYRGRAVNPAGGRKDG